jgi:hypothetical protein
VPSKTQEAIYNKALDIAQNPLSVLKDVKNGTLTSTDTTHLQHLYPALYERIKEKLFSQIIDAKEQEKIIPYKVRMGLSRFLGQPLDVSMQPTSIMSNQQSMTNINASMQSKGNMDKLKQQSIAEQTPQQARAADRQN